MTDPYENSKPGEAWNSAYPFIPAKTTQEKDREIATLRAKVEELERERDEARTWAYQQRLKKFRSGCACHISDDERLVRACDFHREFVTRAEAAESRLSEATRLAAEALEMARHELWERGHPEHEDGALWRIRTALDRLNAMKGESDG